MEEPTFKRFLHVRLENGGSLASVGRDFGVTKQAVARWLRGERPSRMALMLARHVMALPGDVCVGLPGAERKVRG